MDQIKRAIGMRVRRVMAAMLLLTGLVSTAPMLAGIASAHHPDITASAACTGVVSWTSTAWAGDGTANSRRNSDIEVKLTIVGGSGTAPAAVHGAYTTANGYSFSGTFTWPTGATGIQVTATAKAKWGNNTAAGDSRTTNTILKPTNCGGTPGVSKAVSCVAGTPGNGDGKVVFTFTNNGGPFANSVSYTIPAFNGKAASTFVVAKGATVTKPYTLIADGNYTVLITSDTSPKTQTQTFTIDCDSPVPSVSNKASCDAGNGKIIVTLKNTGGESVVFTVTPPTGGASSNYTVAAGGMKDITFSDLADATYTILIKANGANYNQTFTVDCDHPAPVVTSAASCDANSHDGSVTVTLSNSAGTEAVTFNVTNPFTNTVEAVVVAAGGSTTRNFNGFSDGNRSVVISVPGNATNFTQTFTVACDLAPTFSYTSGCTSGDGVVTVTLKNDGDDVNATFVLQGTTHTLAPGQTKVVALAPFADGNANITLSVNGLNKNFSVTIDCDRPGQPAVDIAQVCANEDGTATLTLKNIGGQLPLTFVVNATSYSVPANSTLNVDVAGLNDGSNTIVVTQNGVHFDKTITVACDKAPTVDHAESCVEGSGGVSKGKVQITLHNNGDDVGMVFTVNGTPTASVPPKGSLVVTIDNLADGPHAFTVSGGGKTFDFSVTTSCDHPGTPSVTTEQACVTVDGQVIVHLTATGGELPVAFLVNGTAYSVQPNTTVDATVNGLNDGLQHITVTSGATDFSFDVTVNCDAPPKVTATAECTNFDGTVSVLLENPGDDVSVKFTVNGTDYIVAAGGSTTATVSGLADGPYSITLSINDVAQPALTGTTDCDPVVSVTAVCNTVDTSGAVSLYWYTVTNTEGTDLTLTWDGGSATIPTGGTKDIASTTKPLSLKYLGTEIASLPATDANCTRDVTFTKVLEGQPPTGETYSIRVSRLDGGAQYEEETTFDLKAGEPVTVSLPSTLDPAGIDYKFEEIDAGTAATSSMSPDQLKLTGNLGETISVVVTNGYSSVQIIKQSLTPTVVAGGTITYTLQATNTGGLTLDPVVISDRLPAQVEYQSVSVEGNGGTCALAQSARPQLLVCTMLDALPVGGLTKVITLTVKVDSNVASGTTILNQAKVLGTYEQIVGPQSESLSAAADTDLSCLPAIAGTVCDLSAQVGVPVSEIDQAGPTTTTTIVDRGQLPATGSSGTIPLLALAFGLAGLGSVLLISRRRTAR
ncbi:MAG TPA: LPXTG cell wall anchor domain-containing protein [Ilumatobacteraceae bacterium]|nr:LPXTG cell wall anchor domain-containing protein [Ilumatobacteraceae bacterium]HRB02585.1 LPXTG cell wall anchor domain-containing protein [Ilumatobacteraceae bacterium]